MPGMTHLQHAQPVLLAHHLLAHVHALARDVDRLRDWDRRAAISPLGSGALAGSSLPLDPAAVAAELGFDAAGGQLDRRRLRPRLRRRVPVRRRAARRAPVPARRGGHPLGHAPSSAGSRLDDAWSTGSSIMPQKKNPDIAELARGKSGRLIGNLTGLLVDAQGPAAGLRPGPAGGQGAGLRRVDQLLVLLPAVTGLVATLAFDDERLAAAAPPGLRAGHRRRRVAGAPGRRRSARRTRSAARSWPTASERGLTWPS